MKKILKLYKAVPTGNVPLLVLLLISLCGCAWKEENPIEIKRIEIPEELLTPVPLPMIPDPDHITDIELGVLLQNDEKALEACNSKLKAIKNLASDVN